MSAGKVRAGNELGCGAVGVFGKIAVGQSEIGAQAQHVVVTHRGAHLELAAEAGRGRVALVERLLEAGRRDHDVREVAPLAVDQRIELPIAVTDQPEADVFALALAVGAHEAQGAVVVERHPARLQFDVRAERLDQPRLGGPAVVGGAGRRGHPLAFGRGPEALPAVPLAGDHREALAEFGRDAAAELGLAAIVDQGLPVEQAQFLRVCAFELDRAGKRARAERTRAAAAGHADVGDLVGHDRRQRDIAEHRIGHRHPVEQHLRAAGGVAVERAQGDALRAGVGRAAVRAAEFLESRDVRQRILDPARGGRDDLLARDVDHIVGGGRRRLIEPAPGDDDDVGVIRILRHRRCRQRQAGDARQQHEADRHRSLPQFRTKSSLASAL